MRIILLGPPGVGKGTQAQMVVKRLKAVQLSTGDLLRAAIRSGSELGRSAKQYMDVGDLVPDDIVLGLVGEWLAEQGERCVIFDGFPRTIAQAEGFDRLLEKLGSRLNHVLELVIDDGIVIERISARRSCPACGAVFNLLSAPPSVENVCDNCGHVGLELRKDDRPEVIANRLRVYHRQTAPLAEYYRQRGILTAIDGSQSVDAVRDEIKAVLGA
jgi:adenylate kinase